MIDAEQDSRSILEAAAPKILQAASIYKVPTRGKVLVGASGGKDSTFLALLLRHMGFDVCCLVVDMGYPDFDAKAIAENLRRLGLQVEVCELRQTLSNLSFAAAELEILRTNFRELDSETCQTPCGACSQNKRLAMVRFAAKNGFAYVALGHHRDDFLVTILKDYFAANYFEIFGRYEWQQFRTYIAEVNIDESALKQMCLEGRAGTMAVCLPIHSEVSLIRPLLFVPESEIVSARSKLGIHVFSSGCSHSIFTTGGLPPTKRELVHADLQTRLQRDSNLADRLMPLMLSTLSSDGIPLSNPRQKRSALLPGFVQE